MHTTLRLNIAIAFHQAASFLTRKSCVAEISGFSVKCQGIPNRSHVAGAGRTWIDSSLFFCWNKGEVRSMYATSYKRHVQVQDGKTR